MRLLLRLLCAVTFAVGCGGAGAVPQFSGPPALKTMLPQAGGEALIARGDQGEVFVANEALDRVAVVGRDFQVTYVPVGRGPRYIVGGANGFVTSNAGDNTVSIGRDVGTATTIPVGGFGPMLARGGKLYQTRADGTIAIIDLATATTTTFDTGLGPLVPPAADNANLYIANPRGNVQVYDITAGAPRLTLGVRLSVNAYALAAGANGKFYALTDSGGGGIVEIDAKVGAAQAFAFPGAPQSPRTIIVAGRTVMAGFGNGIGFLDLPSRNADFVRTGAIRSFAFDEQSLLAFAVEDSQLDVFQTQTRMRWTVPLAAGSQQVQFFYKPCVALVSGPVLTVVDVPCSDNPWIGVSAHALWWVPQGAESGWGLNIAHHGFVGVLFATWFTYDANGQPTWVVMSDGRDAFRNGYRGTLYRTTGPPFSSPSFDPSKVTRTPVGTMEISVSSVNDAAMNATVDGVGIRKTLARQVFASPVPVCDSGLAPGALPIYQDLWWNPSESGWGLNIAHQGNILFITWFTYDTDGKPTWFVGSDIEKTGNATYSGTLYKTFGPPMTVSPWDPSKVTRMPVGNATLTFRDDDNGTFAYTVNGASGSKAITRQVYATPVTRCR